MIGKLYRAGEKVADKHGLGHPDAIVFPRAYAQAVDASKHGNSIDFPERLLEQVGMSTDTSWGKIGTTRVEAATKLRKPKEAHPG